jgi:phage FluMu protein Com
MPDREEPYVDVRCSACREKFFEAQDLSGKIRIKCPRCKGIRSLVWD